MASSQATPEYVAEAASACRRSAADIQAQLATLRYYVLSLGAQRLALPPARFQALMIGYDIYVRMLGDALTDIATCLRTDGEACDRLDTTSSPVGHLPRSNHDQCAVVDVA